MKFLTQQQNDAGRCLICYFSRVRRVEVGEGLLEVREGKRKLTKVAYCASVGVRKRWVRYMKVRRKREP